MPNKPSPILHLTCAYGTLDSIRAELAGVYRALNPGAAYRTDQEIQNRLKVLSAYVVVPSLDASTLVSLEKTYPELIFISYYHVLEYSEIPEGATMVVPNLDPIEERQIWVDIENSYVGLY